MKMLRGTVKGRTVVLEQDPDLPEGCQALVEIRPLEKSGRDEVITRRNIERLLRAPKGGRLRYRKREELYDRGR